MTGSPTAVEPPAGDGTLRRAGVATILLSGAVAGGQLITVGREVFVAGQVGTSASLDALLIALVAPITLGGLLQNGTAAALLTGLGLLDGTEGRATALRLAGVVITWTVIIGVLLALAVALLAGPVIALTGPGLERSTAALATSVVPLVAPLLVLTALGTLLTTLCQVADRFRPIGLAAVINPLVTAVLTVALWDRLEVVALGIAMVAGAATSTLVLGTGAARAGMLPRPALRGPRPHVRAFGRHAGPLWLSSLGLTTNLFVDRAVASLLTVGSVGALRFGETLLRTPVASLGTAWGTVASPLLVRSAAGRADELGATATRLARSVVALAMPGAIGAMALAPSVVAVVYQRGAFDAAAARATAGVVACLAPMVVLTMIEAVLIGSHNARRAGVTLLAAGLIHVAINISLDLLLIHPFGIAGIALATSAAYVGGLSFLAVLLARREPAFDLGSVLRIGARSFVASLVPAVPVAAVSWGLAPDAGLVPHAIVLLGGAAVGIVGFTVLARVLRIDEVAQVLAVLTARARRFAGRRSHG